MNSGCGATLNELLLASSPALKLKSSLACRLTGVGGIQGSSEFPLISQVCLLLPLLTHFDGGLQVLRLRSNFVLP